MKEIKLTQGKVALVDNSDFDWLNQWKWYLHKGRKTNYAARIENNKCIKMHRFILDIKPPNILCDHIDHNGLNNQRNNLRIATASQNAANRNKRSNSTSKYLGVYWHNQINKWRAMIRINKRLKCLGCFDDEREAAMTYNSNAKKQFGEFANLNFINKK